MKHCYVYYSRRELTAEFDGKSIVCTNSRRVTKKLAIARAASHYFSTAEDVIVWYHTASTGYRVIASFGRVFAKSHTERYYGMNIESV